MKNIFKKILELKLRFLAKAILNKYKPEVVAITGSVGKTSTKEAIYTVLASAFNCRRNQKNYNNEIGIPLTIIGAEAGGKNPFKWFGVFIKAAGLLIKKDNNYPKILVLEMGADRVGDIKYLTSFVPVKVGVITTIAPVHLEFFGTLEMIAKEKGMLIQNLAKDGYAVLNYDDKLVQPMRERTKAKVITFGNLPQADVSASDIAISHDVSYKDVSTIQGISFKVVYQGKTVPVLLPKVLGRHLVPTALAAIAVGIIYNLNLHNIVAALKNFQPPLGRMRIIPGIKNTLIIDDTYNSSPLAVRQALYQLSQINLNSHHKKYAVLGDMLELGVIAEQAHQEIGEAVVEYGIDYLITVGEISRDTVRGAIKKGMSKDHCFNFPNSLEAGKFLQQRINEGDLLLIKGSQGMRMEKAVKELMAEPQKAAELLVRQDKEWVR
ncbi:MAG: UDP-N-acetylmuramoyl-tripeptide--D-alanyl-D-alanine ligase [Patescibacteria group bacterium]|jgi:UDP-N-acetylmuramoyl-tripeptide--D-alanyl-D-alanine ligase